MKFMLAFVHYALLQQKNTAAVAHVYFFGENSSQLQVREYTNAFYSKNFNHRLRHMHFLQ
jgi:hypothetical protein